MKEGERERHKDRGPERMRKDERRPGIERTSRKERKKSMTRERDGLRE